MRSEKTSRETKAARSATSHPATSSQPTATVATPTKAESDHRPAFGKAPAPASFATSSDAELKPQPTARTPAALLAIPPILLEGDTPITPAASGPGQRCALGPQPPGPPPGAVEAGTALPEAYGTARMFLAARDPHWLYAHWDLTREQQRGYNALSQDGHLAVRVYLNEIRGEPFAQAHVHPESTHWFIHVGRGGAKFVAELGYTEHGGNWVRVSTSTATLTPPDALSADISAEFATIPFDMSLTQLLLLVKEAVRDHVPLPEALAQLQAAGYAELPTDPKPPAQWTPAQERALAELLAMDSARRVWMGSLEITELIRRQWQHDISSAVAAQFSMPMGAAGGGTMPGITSPFGGMPGRKGFWFNVNAELVLYGATDPGATASIGGRVIKLRPDGTFSYRFALPDGNYELLAVAASAEGDDVRQAELRFSRQTEYGGDIGAHPQDPSLNLPHADNVG